MGDFQIIQLRTREDEEISERRGAQAAGPARYTVVRSAIALRGSRRRKARPGRPAVTDLQHPR